MLINFCESPGFETDVQRVSEQKNCTRLEHQVLRDEDRGVDFDGPVVAGSVAFGGLGSPIVPGSIVIRRWKMPNTTRGPSSTTLVNEEDIFLCFGCWCCNVGLYSKDYVGCASELTLCCLETLCCLKAGTEPLWCKFGGGPGKCCRFGLGLCSLGIVRPRGCCVTSGQLCCLGCDGIIPTDDDFPRTIACFGMMCRPKCGLCPRLSTVPTWSRSTSKETELSQPQPSSREADSSNVPRQGSRQNLV